MPPVTLVDSVEELQLVRNKVGLVLGLPMGRQVVRREWAIAMQAISWPVNTSVLQSVVADSPIDKARELICEQALIVNAPYVWFVDDDTVPPSNAIKMLLFTLEQHPEAAAIGGVYCVREDPPMPLVFSDNGKGINWDWKVGEVFETWAMGAGCLLIRTEALKKIEKPWFKTVDVAVGEASAPGTIPINRLFVGEDVYFCNKVQKVGYKILAHGGVLCDHWDTDSGVCYTLPKDSKPWQNAVNI